MPCSRPGALTSSIILVSSRSARLRKFFHFFRVNFAFNHAEIRTNPHVAELAARFTRCQLCQPQLGRVIATRGPNSKTRWSGPIASVPVGGVGGGGCSPATTRGLAASLPHPHPSPAGKGASVTNNRTWSNPQTRRTAPPLPRSCAPKPPRWRGSRHPASPERSLS